LCGKRVCASRWCLPSRFLTDEGIEYLRDYLNLPSEIVPATLKKSTRPLERNTGCVAGLPQCTLPLAVAGFFLGVSVACTLPLTCAVVQRRSNQVLAYHTCGSRQLLHAHTV